MHRIDGAGHVDHMFVGEDVANSRPPTEFTPEWFNAVQEEVAGVVEGAGIALVKGDNTQLLQAIAKKGLQGNYFNSSIAGGTADAITGAYTPPITALTDGMELSVYCTSANATSALTFKADGTPAKGVVKGNGIAVVPGDCLPGWNHFKYDFGRDKWALQNPATGTWAVGRLIGLQIFDVSGTYTPTPGMSYSIVRCQGAGAGGGGSSVPAVSQWACAGGGSSGALGVGKYSAATIGASQPITIGTGGLGGAAGVNNGQAGGTSSFGTLLSSPGGIGGSGASGQTSPWANGGGVQTNPSVGGTILNAIGIPGESGNILGAGYAISGAGGGSPISGGCGGGQRVIQAHGENATAPGAGGSGAYSYNTTAAFAGGNGKAGRIIVEEYA